MTKLRLNTGRTSQTGLPIMEGDLVSGIVNMPGRRSERVEGRIIRADDVWLLRVDHETFKLNELDDIIILNRPPADMTVPN